MEVKDLHHYSKDVDSDFKFFSDPATVEAKFAGLGARNIELLESGASGSMHITKIKREVPAEGIPALLRKFLGDWNKVVQTEKWRAQEGGVRRCELDVNIVNVPVSVVGTMTLRPEGSGCVNDVRINVTCGIPLVGKPLAEFVARNTKKNMDAEYAYIKGQLA